MNVVSNSKSGFFISIIRSLLLLLLISILAFIHFSSHPELTNLVARKSGVKPGNVVLEKFANNETRVLLEDTVRVIKQ